MYSILHKGKIIGQSRLENGDPPMGIACGVFIPARAFDEIRQDPSDAQPDQRQWAGLELTDKDGNPVACEGGVFITEFGPDHDPLELQVSCLGIDSNIYARLFPHHVEAYEQSIS